MNLKMVEKKSQFDPNFGEDIAHHDIGLIKLPQSQTFSKHIRPVNLPKTCINYEHLAITVIGNV